MWSDDPSVFDSLSFEIRLLPMTAFVNEFPFALFDFLLALRFDDANGFTNINISWFVLPVFGAEFDFRE
ncbi:hypothetical protein BRC85_07190 [Halobacteriales archaeon QS_1_69_70]|nr:MAG: hypothetical protein BRC85_07190 [Halobacteriales archaeon QS_1_69_70]